MSDERASPIARRCASLPRTPDRPTEDTLVYRIEFHAVTCDD
jgi:hypothetical protein